MMTSFRAHQRLIGHFNDIFGVVLRRDAHAAGRASSGKGGVQVGGWVTRTGRRFCTVETQERFPIEASAIRASAIATRSSKDG
jgi:hypothetical protein